MRLVYTRLARADLLAAQTWYSQREPALGTRFVTTVAAAAKKLQGRDGRELTVSPAPATVSAEAAVPSGAVTISAIVGAVGRLAASIPADAGVGSEQVLGRRLGSPLSCVFAIGPGLGTGLAAPPRQKAAQHGTRFDDYGPTVTVTSSCVAKPPSWARQRST